MKLKNCELNTFIINLVFAFSVLGFALFAPCLGQSIDENGKLVHQDGTECVTH